MASLKFSYHVGGVSLVEGTAHCGPDALELQLAMTESIEGPVGEAIERLVPWNQLEEVVLKRQFPAFWKQTLVFTARDVKAFQRIPGARGFQFEVTPRTSGRELREFVAEARLAAASAEQALFESRIERSLRSD